MARQYLNAARGRDAGVSQLIAQLNQAVSERSEDLTPITLVAGGDNIRDFAVAAVSGQPLDIRARVPLAYKLATYFNSRLSNPTPDFLQARLWGDLHAVWFVGEGTNDQRISANARLDSILIANPIEGPMMLQAFQKVYDTVRAAEGAGNIPWDEASAVVPLAPDAQDLPNEFPLQKYRFFEASAHAFDNTALVQVTAATQDALASLREINENAVNVPPHNFVLNEAWPQNWARLSRASRLACFEMLYHTNKVEWDSYLVASVAGVVFSICKSSGMTTAYLQTRVDRLVKDYPELELQDKLMMEFFMTFGKLYVPQNLDRTVIANYLQAVYGCLEEGPSRSIAWVIEQARGHNYTHALAFAESCSKTKYLPIAYLANIREDQWIGFIKVCYHVCRDPWGSLTGPAIPANNYPDIANIGAIMSKKLDKAARGYAGKFILGGEHTEPFCKAVADQIIESHAASLEDELSAANIIAALFPGIKMAVVGDNAYYYDESGLPLELTAENARPVGGWEEEEEPAPAAGAAARPAAGFPGNVNREVAYRGEQPLPQIAEDALAESRATWANKAKNLPRNAVKMTMKDQVLLLEEYVDTDRHLSAIKTCCNLLLYASKQSKLEPYGGAGDNIRVKNRYVASPAGLDNALNVWGLDGNDIIPDIPEDAPNVPYNENVMGNVALYARPIRPIVQNRRGNAGLGGMLNWQPPQQNL
ncbi:nucleocapsid protein [Taiyuan leafhopper virus]|uniref:Nucleocapsid protein n=1 Tax=Taiyuan leafhopper virus TaxID=2482723 RepID=A0A455LK58_9VIRU|nr:nucleocapsid protein [Taiyuan leafhopper virus]AYN64866.1 nucleocapsid protein [Taiyuan leafhopper virus]